VVPKESYGVDDVRIHSSVLSTQLPIPAAIGTVPLGSVSRFLLRENVIGVLYRAEPLVPYPFRKVRGSAVKGIWVVHPNEFIIFRKTALESVSTRKASAVSLVKLTSIFHLFLIRSPGEVKDLVGRRLRVQRVRISVPRNSGGQAPSCVARIVNGEGDSAWNCRRFEVRASHEHGRETIDSVRECDVPETGGGPNHVRTRINE